MAIKQQQPVTKAEFEAALVTLRLSVSEVARETEIPRHVVSHFRNYGDGMKPEQLAKLRDFLEEKGIEFTEEEASAAPQPAEAQATLQSITLPAILSDDGLTQRTALVCRHFFVDERLTEDQLKEAGTRVEECFLKARELLNVELVKSWGNYDEATDTKLRELWGHLARIGLVCLHIQGRILIDQNRVLAGALPEKDRPEPKTLGDLLANTYREAVAGLNVDGQPAEIEQQLEIEEETA